MNVTASKGSQMCPMCGETEEVDLYHIQRCQRLTEAMDNVSNKERWWKISKLHWTAK
jgi:hypothetical protein